MDLFHFCSSGREKKMSAEWKLMVCCDLNRVPQIWILVETFWGSHPWREISMTEEENEPSELVRTHVEYAAISTKIYDRLYTLLNKFEFATNYSLAVVSSEATLTSSSSSNK